MNKLILFISTASLLMISLSLNAQKVKYKKGQVIVDKVHKYDFVHTNEDDKDSELKHYSLTDMDGVEILSLSDTSFYYFQLPNESSPRKAYEAYVVSAPSIGLRGVMPYNPVMGYPSQRIKDLKKVGFFKSGNMTENIFKEFLDKQYPKAMADRLAEIEVENDNRKKNYQLTSEMFAPLLERKPSKVSVVIDIDNTGSYLIKEGGNVELAKIRLVNKGSNNVSYEVSNSDATVAEINLFVKPEIMTGISRYRYNAKPTVYGAGNSAENYKWFYDTVKKIGSPKSRSSKLNEIANFLVNEGLL